MDAKCVGSKRDARDVTGASTTSQDSSMIEYGYKEERNGMQIL